MTYLDLDTATGRAKRQAALTESTGAADAGKIVALNSLGQLDSTLMVEQQEAQAIGIVEAGDWVHIFDDDGVLRCWPALAINDERSTCGYVRADAENAAVIVYFDGINDVIDSGPFDLADRAKTVYLSAEKPGKCQTDPPELDGSVVQPLGRLIRVGDVVAVALDFRYDIQLAGIADTPLLAEDNTYLIDEDGNILTEG